MMFNLALAFPQPSTSLVGPSSREGVEIPENSDPLSVVPFGAQAPWLSGLSTAQRAAVVDDAPRVLVLAGAGSGKTRALVAKVAHLLLVEQFPPESIKVFSFTRKACEEITGRLIDQVQAELGEQPLPPITQTFHSFAWRLVRQHFTLLGFHTRPELLSEDSALSVVDVFERFLRSVQPSHPPLKPGELLKRMRPEARALPDPTLAHMEPLFLTWKQQQGWVELPDLLPLAIRLMRGPVGETLRRQLKAVLIDEFQDIDPEQWALFEGMLGEQTRFALFGDDDQAIYRWRGSEPELLRAQHRRAEVKTHLLTVNYRCRAPILRLANAVVEGDVDRVHRAARAHRSGGMKPQVITATDQPRAVARAIQAQVRGGRGLMDIAVLVRDHADGAAIRRALERQKIPVSRGAEGYGVKVLTYHSSKGLEFPIVMLPFLDRGRFPATFRLQKQRADLHSRLARARLAARRLGVVSPSSPALSLRPISWTSRLVEWGGKLLCRRWSPFRRWGDSWREHRRQAQAQLRKQDEVEVQWLSVLQKAHAEWPQELKAIHAEERRLCYVAMTRAREGLWMFCHSRAKCSEFLHAVPQALMEWHIERT